MTRKMIVCAILLIFLLQQALPTEAGEYCQYGYSYFSSSYSSRYCDFGCCGSKSSYYSDVCCVNVGLIAGSVIAGLVGLAILIGIIVCCCAAANNSNRRIGTVIHPSGTAMQTLVVNNTSLAQGTSTIPGPQGPVGYGYAFGVPQPPYAQYNNVPQGSANSAYPPPPAAKY